MQTVIGCVFFLFSTASKFKTSMARVPYNKILTNLAIVARAVLGNIGPQSFLYGPRFSRSVRRPYCHDLGPIFPSAARATIARLVRG